MTFTPRQEESLDIERNLSVHAGAGSGKTMVLVERYLTILRSSGDVMPSNILALTFTEKASLEMKDRIMTEVRVLSDEEGGRWIRVREDMENAEISTIHGFCTGLLRSEGLFIGVDPDFSVLTETEIAKILSEIMNGMFTTPGPESMSLRRLIVDLGQRATASMLRSLVRDRAKLPYEIGSPELREASIRFLRERTEEMVSGAEGDLESIIPILKHLSSIRPPPQPRDSGVRLLENLSEVLTLMRDDIDRKGILSALHRASNFLLTRGGQPRKFSSLGNSGVWGADHRALKEAARGLAEFVSKHAPILPFIENDMLLKRSEYRLLDVLNVLEVLHERFVREKDRLNAMDFDDQISMAVRLLAGNGDLLGSLRKRYTHILVDEFQDTDPRQWRIVELLWNGGESCKLFIVGDPKQSIYGFRSADVRLFLEATSLLDGHDEGRVVVLDRNFRSSFEIMEFVNGVFPRLMAGTSNRWSVPFDPLEPHRGRGGSVTVVTVMDSKGSEEREGRKAAELISRALREWKVMDSDGPRAARFSDIALLFPTRTGFDRYEDALRNASIPYQVYKSGGFFKRQEVKDVLDLLNFLVDRNDDISLASVLKGPFFSLTDEDLLSISLSEGSTLWEKMGHAKGYGHIRSILSRSIDLAYRSEPVMALFGIFSLTGVHGAVGGRRQYRNIDRLLEWASDPSVGTSVRELRDSLQRMVDDPPREGEPQFFVEDDVVSLLTIHAAKGLEWPIVFVLGLEHEGRKWENICRISQDEGIAMKVLDTDSGKFINTPSYEFAARDNEVKESEEKKRVFYVACTRARDHLVLSGAIPVDRYGKEKEPNGLMKLLVDGMELTVDDIDAGCREVGRMKVNIVKVPPYSVEEIEEEEHAEMPPVQPLQGREIEIECGRIPAGDAPFLSPSSPEVSSLLGLESGTNSFKRRGGRGETSPAPHEIGEMVHRILEGIPARRVVREFGYPDQEKRICGIAENIRNQIRKLSFSEEFREVEFVGYLFPDSGEHPLKGRIDLMLMDAEENVLIVDFKTGAGKEGYEGQLKAYENMVRPLVKGRVKSMIISPEE